MVNCGVRHNGYRFGLCCSQCGRRRSTHSNMRSVARRSTGTSSASSTTPNGSIHKPNTGNMLRKLPRISSTPMQMRKIRCEGRRSHRADERQLFGSRSISCSICRSRLVVSSLTLSSAAPVDPISKSTALQRRLSTAGTPASCTLGAAHGGPVCRILRLAWARHRGLSANGAGQSLIRHRKAGRHIGGLARGARIARCG